MTEDYSKNNERFLKLLSYYLFAEERLVSADALNEVVACGVTPSYAFALLLAEGLGVDADGEDRRFFNDYFLPSVKELSVDDYYSDGYAKLVKPEPQKVGDAELKFMRTAPCEGFVRDDFEYLEDGRVIPLIGFFREEYSYLAALKDGREWMTLLPNEINSQKAYVDEANGRVLTYGLGLGYYVFKVAEKDSVLSVTAVDKDEEVIKLFTERILPFFPQKIKDKIKLVKADAFEYAEGLADGAYDYIYADIWRDVSDGLELYERFKACEKFCPSARYGYWIEKTMWYYLNK